MGFYLDDDAETLFAIYSHPTQALAYKSPEVDLLLAFDLALSGVPGDSIQIKDTGPDINLVYSTELAQMATAEINVMYRHLERTFALLDAGLLN